MITEVVMERELFGGVIRQKSKSEMFSATDLVLAGNKWRVSKGLPFFNLAAYFQNKGTKEFMKELENEYGVVKINSRGKGGNTWVHPFLFIDIALAISPELKIKAYQWLYDCLLKYRNDSGDSYKKMCGSLYITETNKSLYTQNICKVANRIKLECGVQDWQSATEEQLKLRDKIQDNISLLSDIIKDRENLIDISVKKAKEDK
ncbi:MAG: KilA-N domain-containing protein [Clostridia bacterium]|jgi:hypothetical protein|nr:KilA-N domain-containing protein [Clostridia bacterium]